MAYCSLVVETMGKHRDWRSQKHAKRCRAYEAEVLRCMDEMERIKPIINAEAETYRMRLPEAPRVRPPPVHAARGARTRDFDNRGDALTAGTIHRGGMGPSLRVTGAVSGGC